MANKLTPQEVIYNYYDGSPHYLVTVEGEEKYVDKKELTKLRREQYEQSKSSQETTETRALECPDPRTEGDSV